MSLTIDTTPAPFSCDTFVALPPATAGGGVIFAKNSDRPADEVQEVVYLPARSHAPGDKVKCTYIEIDQVPLTNAVILSKPAWIWGAEMAANEHGVCIGNEAVWTKLSGPQDLDKKLIGMDFVRLGVERGCSAEEAMGVITSLLAAHGQGGLCSEEPGSQFSYHNSFIIADHREAWVLETAGGFWAAEHVTGGVRNISNFLTIGSRIDAMSPGLKEHALKAKLWDAEDGEFNFAKAYSGNIPYGWDKAGCEAPSHRFQYGKEKMEKMAETNSVSLSSMFSLLRDTTGGICRGVVNPAVATTGSLVSVLHPPTAALSSHWLTATPDPRRSVYKPFVFATAVVGCPHVVSPSDATDRRHALYRAWIGSKVDVAATLQALEAGCVAEVTEYTRRGRDARDGSDDELRTLFNDTVDAELKLRLASAQ